MGNELGKNAHEDDREYTITLVDWGPLYYEMKGYEIPKNDIDRETFSELARSYIKDQQNMQKAQRGTYTPLPPPETIEHCLLWICASFWDDPWKFFTYLGTRDDQVETYPINSYAKVLWGFNEGSIVKITDVHSRDEENTEYAIIFVEEGNEEYVFTHEELELMSKEEVIRWELKR